MERRAPFLPTEIMVTGSCHFLWSPELGQLFLSILGRLHVVQHPFQTGIQSTSHFYLEISIETLDEFQGLRLAKYTSEAFAKYSSQQTPEWGCHNLHGDPEGHRGQNSLCTSWQKTHTGCSQYGGQLLTTVNFEICEPRTRHQDAYYQLHWYLEEIPLGEGCSASIHQLFSPLSKGSQNKLHPFPFHVFFDRTLGQ